MFFANFVFKNDMFYYFLRIYDVIKIIVMTYILLNCVFKNDIFLRICNVINNYDIMFFDNRVFENDMFMYILQLRLYQPNY